MKVAVIGANGKEGSMIVKEALDRGLDVTSIVRDSKKSPTDKYLVRDFNSLQTEDLQGIDVLVDALGFFGPNVKEYVPAMKHFIEILQGTKTRLLVVGGAGSLYVDQAHTKQLYQQADFPEAIKELSQEMGNSLDVLRQSSLNWTFISPAAMFDFKGPRTGKYILAGEELTFDKDGKSEISYADFAIAMVDEIINAKHQRERISVRW
jgi:Putative NADH-flavin reductase